MRQDLYKEEWSTSVQYEDHEPGIAVDAMSQSEAEDPEYYSNGKLCGKVALITRGDSDMGREIAIAYAKEGADIAIIYLDEHGAAAEETKRQVERYGRRCITIAANTAEEQFYKQALWQTVDQLGRLDILVITAPNSAGEKTAIPSNLSAPFLSFSS